MLRIVMDGAGDMPAEWKDEYQIAVIPINIHFGERTFLQGVDLSNDDFYRIVRESGTIPKTSQPSPQQFIDFYRRIAQPGDTILSVHVTSKLSGTYESAVAAQRELGDEFDIHPIDSFSGSAAMGYICREARELERSGASLDDILARVEAICQSVAIILTLDSLDFARMSGRVKALRAALASLLNVKPIVALNDGVLDMADRVRTRRKALDYVVTNIQERVGTGPVNAAVVHAQDPEAARVLMEQVRQTLDCRNLVMTDLSISVAANLGPGTVGVIAYPVEGS